MSNTDRLIVYVSNDNLVEIIGLQNAASDAYLNGATVTFTLKDSADAAVTGATTISMTYVSGSSGDYRGTLADTVSLTADAKYTCEITADGGAGLKGVWKAPVRAEDRKE